MANEDLLARWDENWLSCQPYGPVLRQVYPDRWVRFHTLPGSKRYPDTVDELATILGRYNAILDELFCGQDVFVVSPDWSDEPPAPSRPAEHEAWHPGARYWTSVDLESGSQWHMYVSTVHWTPGCLDPLLDAAADDKTAGVLIMDATMRRVCHPYDGGIDVLLVDLAEVDPVRSRFTDWLSPNASGL
ncbi:DUF3885 domain-containing protein [Labedaea rhizosphaerae]|uniref:DUF3885 domain-containing protein n=1 Tax=Labedaea rhizosphaerae TaxID=598644 RepID=A0A4R6SLU1_LABRH|nr:hypothetical protein [Labedaea rhizosphaerae]TDQ04937.1 hypothetical protein EV186_101898 [Labedaea rhizosphaerae]